MGSQVNAEQLPLVVLRDTVIFPGTIVSLLIERECSMQAVVAASDRGQHLAFFAEKKPDVPLAKSLYPTGTKGELLQQMTLSDGRIKLLVKGLYRIKRTALVACEGYWAIVAQPQTTLPVLDSLLNVLIKKITALMIEWSKFQKLPDDIIHLFKEAESPEVWCDILLGHLDFSVPAKQKLLQEKKLQKRLEQLLLLLKEKIELFQLEKRIHSTIKKQTEKNQKEYYLQEQLKAIQKELEESLHVTNEWTVYEEKIKKLKLTTAAREKAQYELTRLRQMQPNSAESSVSRHYLDWLLNLPWGQYSAGHKKIVLNKAQRLLDQEHYGLSEIKERILEYLAVFIQIQRMNTVKTPRSTVLCLIGPPGVGKTTFAASIAKAMGRKFTKIALGGLRDEAEIRGHRRTYIGALPGKLIQAIRKLGVDDPVILLDEIDKLGNDFRGDPASALLELLDPEQNHAFQDHFLEADYDLSKVIFIATANSYNIPAPLLDRLEVLNLSGYLETEKLAIVQKHLLPKQMRLHGLEHKSVRIEPGAIMRIIRHYTEEAGVRALERQIAKFLRKLVRERLEQQKETPFILTSAEIERYLGLAPFRHDPAEHKEWIGLVQGLAWTPTGGELLKIEALAFSQGTGKIVTTGSLGDVLEESIKAALSVVRTHAKDLKVSPKFYQEYDLHVHLPAGAIAKDGPSAGIAISTALLSALSGLGVRTDLAMTGEINLRGEVLPIGGLKEKLLAAHRAGIAFVIIPFDNLPELPYIPAAIKQNIKIHGVKKIQEVWEISFTQYPGSSNA